MTDRTAEQVRRWANELIDLSRRNSSLYYQSSDPGAKRRSRSSLEIVHPAPGPLLELLTRLPAVDFFSPPPDGGVGPAWTVTDSKQAATESELVTDRTTAADLRTTLRSLARQTSADDIDKGLQTLFICFGMLVWREAEITDEDIHSPLVFVPVRLEREAPGEPYRLVRAEGDAVLNPSLKVALEERFAVQLPDLDPELGDARALGAVFESVRAAVRGWRWQVQPRVALKRATFHKEAMYRDLLDNLEFLAEHPLVTALGDPEAVVPELRSVEIPDEHRMDDVAPPEHGRSILDADASQRRAIYAALQGASFVMDGPPGTGKSQTIANMVAELIAAGRSVLFVSEKVAALDVVASRLSEPKLDDFLFRLHSNKVSRKEVAAELGRALRTHPAGRPRVSSSTLEQARHRREHLSMYAAAVNVVRQPLDKPATWVLGRLAQLADLPTAPVPSSVDQTLRATEVADYLDRFDALARVWAPVERDEDFLWRELLPDKPRAGARNHLQRVLDELAEALSATDELGADVASEAGLPAPGTLGEAERLVGIVTHVAVQPTTHQRWWSHPDLEGVEARLEALRVAAEEQRREADRLATAYGPNWQHLPSDGASRLEAALSRLHAPEVLIDPGERLDDDRLAVLMRMCAEGIELATELGLEGAYLANALGAGQRVRTVGEVRNLAVVAEAADVAVRPEAQWATAAVAAQVEQALHVLQPLVHDYQQRRSALTQTFDDQVYDLDLQGLVTRFQSVHTGIHKLGGTYRADKRLVASVSRSGKTSAAVIAQLPEALEVKRLGLELDRQEAASHRLLGRFFSPRATNVDAAVQALQLLSSAAERLGADYDPAAVAEQLAGPGPRDPALGGRARRLRDRLDRWLEEAEQLLPGHPRLGSLSTDAARAWAAGGLAALQDIERLVGAAAQAGRPPADLETFREHLGLRAAIERREFELDAATERDTLLLGDRYQGFDSPWDKFLTGVRWTAELQRRHGGPLPSRAVTRLYDNPFPPSPHVLVRSLEVVRKLRDEILAYFEHARRAELEAELEGSWRSARELVSALGTNMNQVDTWYAFAQCCSELREHGWAAALDFCIERRVSAINLAGTLERAMYTAWFDALSADDPVLGGIDAEQLDANVAQFRDLDRQILADAAERVVQACTARRPTTTIGAAGIIEKEAVKKTRHMPIRKLLERTAEVVTALKPCFMMSPLSVSQLLPPTFRFDTVIFDEASQITPADAVNCVYRGRQLIVAGDAKQLPPTSFFQSGGDEEDAAYEEGQFDVFESVLDLCKGTVDLPSLPLRWHYRSQHESLIAFSNREFYESQLVTFPSAAIDGPDLGVELFVVDGVYLRGGARTNEPEAGKVAERVLFHAAHHADLSLGVVAFSQAQADLIEDKVESLRPAHPELEKLFEGGRLDGFFVKNLENVQGDERDIMIFSVGYGPDENAKMTANFGPLNRDGGWRRLNVAITRARRRVEVISSFSASKLAALHSDSRGVVALQRYLDYAERGISALAIDLTGVGGDTESPLEDSVLSVLRSRGYEVVPQVGTAGYRIDLGVRHPMKAGRFALGVECDGAAYHSSKVARDRDRLRQEVLERLGWRLYRIWGPAWYRNRPEQERRLLAAVEDAIAGDGALATKPARVQVERDVVVAPLDLQPSWTVPYRVYQRAIRSYRHPADPLERSRLAQVVRGILDIEAPIHLELLGRRVAESWERNATRRVQEAVETIVRGLVRNGSCRIIDDFVWTGRDVLIRVPDPNDPQSERDIGHIPPDELDAAVERLLAEARVVSADELLTQVARIFGFRRTGSRIRMALERSLDNMVEIGVAVCGSDGLYRPSGAA